MTPYSLTGEARYPLADALHAIAAMTDGTGDVHTAMLAMHRAEMSMQLTVQVRNKLVQAYQDLMRTPI